MNLSHVLRFGSSLSSLSSRRTFEQGYSREVAAHRQAGGLRVNCRGSDGESRRGSGDDRRSLNGVSDRPRYPRDGDGGYRNSEGSRRNYRGAPGGRYSGSNSKNYRGGEYGRYKGAGGGHGRGRDRKKQMHPGAYSMVDEQTGEKVIVWGVETDDDVPVPTAEDLQWRKTVLAIPGDASDDTWAKVMEDSGSNDSYSVKGVQQGGRDWIDELYEDDVDDDEDDEVFDDYESESDVGEEEIERVESKKVARPARLKVFGRDVRGKSLLKVQTPSTETNGTSSVPVLNGAKFEVDTRSDVDSEAKDTDSKIISNSGNIDKYEFSMSDLEDIDGSKDQQLTETTGSVETSHEVEASTAVSYTDTSPIFANESTESRVGEDPLHERVVGNELYQVEAAAYSERSEELPAVQVTPSDGRKKPQKGLASTKCDEYDEAVFDKLAGGRSRVLKSQNSLADTYTSEAYETPSTSSEEYVERRTRVPKNERTPAPGEYYIIDVTDDDDGSSRKKKYDEEKEGRKVGLLDQLRLQATGQKPMSEDRAEDEESIRTSQAQREPWQSADAGPPPMTPMRDMKARYNYDASIADDFFSQKSFRDVGATVELTRALAYLQVDKPSQIQALSFTPILQGKSCIIAEQTGSGKTIAYVAPLVQRLKADEAAGMGKALPKKPRVLVLVPTSELAAQVLKTFRTLSKGGVPTRSIVLTGGFKWKTQVESLEQGADIVIATPGRLLQHLEAGNIQFDHLKSVVFDEVDILFDDEDFSQALQTINKAASIKVQYVHVTATLPVDVHDDLLERYPDCLSVMGPSLHRTAPGLQEILVDCSGGETDEKTPESAFVNKRTALLQLVNDKPVSKTIVFCNKIETCRKVENILTRYDRTGKKIQVLPYHAALSQEARLETLETFMAPNPKERLFLVCTDRASRGIDSLDVEHVVLFDFPRDPSEYVRRIGRTARGAGGTGKVFVFVVGKQVSAARRIMDRNDKGYPIHDVPGEKYYYSN
ncbi:hypothetical protein Mapa_012162 [Marchantia paleacea]|nr:hypothetical protein Mapa_012162 [Marchantia paleacea]